MWMLKSSEQDLEEADVMLGRQLAGQRWGGGGGRVPSNFSTNLASHSETSSCKVTQPQTHNTTQSAFENCNLSV